MNPKTSTELDYIAEVPLMLPSVSQEHAFIACIDITSKGIITAKDHQGYLIVIDRELPEYVVVGLFREDAGDEDQNLLHLLEDPQISAEVELACDDYCSTELYDDYDPNDHPYYSLDLYDAKDIY